MSDPDGIGSADKRRLGRFHRRPEAQKLARLSPAGEMGVVVGIVVVATKDIQTGNRSGHDIGKLALEAGEPTLGRAAGQNRDPNAVQCNCAR